MSLLRDFKLHGDETAHFLFGLRSPERGPSAPAMHRAAMLDRGPKCIIVFVP
jgi:hypothetical protein